VFSLEAGYGYGINRQVLKGWGMGFDTLSMIFIFSLWTGIWAMEMGYIKKRECIFAFPFLLFQRIEPDCCRYHTYSKKEVVDSLIFQLVVKGNG